MRLLVVDGSTLMAFLVASLTPDGVEVEHALSFGEALRTLRERPPDAAILNFTPTDLPWEDLLEACSQPDHEIPFRCFATVFGAGQGPLTEVHPQCHQVLEKPVALDVLKELIEDIVSEATGTGEKARRVAL